MSENLLHNGGFELDWSVDSSHQVDVYPVDDDGNPAGDMYRVDIENIHTPSGGWVTWHKHKAGKWDQPEVRDARITGDPARVHGGEKATLLFTFYRSHDAGFYQPVHIPAEDLAADLSVRLSAWAHAWSNVHDNQPYTDDPEWSEGAGFEVSWRYEGDYHDLTEQEASDWGNMTFWLGIDPYGGVNPFAPTVVWGRGAHIYNGYFQVPSIDVIPQSAMVTVFFRSRAKWPFKHNDLYLDDVTLEILDPPDLPDLPELPDLDAIPGMPRVNYRRVYCLLPQTAGVEWWTAAGIAMHTSLGTVGASADDAGMGPGLTEKWAKVVNQAEWGTDMGEWFNLYYPGTHVELIDAATPEEMAVLLQEWIPEGGDIALRQRDYAEDLGEDPGGEDISAMGCLLIAVCIALRSQYHRNILPPTLNELLAARGNCFVNDDTLLWMAVWPLFPCFTDGMKVNGTYTVAYLHSLRAEGWEVILALNNGKHFVYLDSQDGSVLRVIDPWTGGRHYQDIGTVTGIRAAKGGGGTGETPDPPDPPDPPAPPTDPDFPDHVQNPVVGMHSAPIVGPPPAGDQDFWMLELEAMGCKWYKLLDSDTRDNDPWIQRLILNGVAPIVRLFQSEQFPGRLAGNLMMRAAKLVEMGVKYFEIANEPNLPNEWKSTDRALCDYNIPDSVARIGECWWADAEQIIAMGGYAGFPAMAPTDRNGTNSKFSSVLWARKLIEWMAYGHYEAARDYISDGRIWFAMHISPFNRPLDYSPWRDGFIDDMCLRAGEHMVDSVLDSFSGIPKENLQIISTEGGAYTPEHLSDLEWEPYSEARWIELVPLVFETLKTGGIVKGLTPWILTDQGVSDPRWKDNGWYRGRDPRGVVRAMKDYAMIYTTAPLGNTDVYHVAP